MTNPNLERLLTDEPEAPVLTRLEKMHNRTVLFWGYAEWPSQELGTGLLASAFVGDALHKYKDSIGLKTEGIEKEKTAWVDETLATYYRINKNYGGLKRFRNNFLRSGALNPDKRAFWRDVYDETRDLLDIPEGEAVPRDGLRLGQAVAEGEVSMRGLQAITAPRIIEMISSYDKI